MPDSTKKRLGRRFLPLIFLWGLLGCSGRELVLGDAWILEAPPNASAQAGYLTIVNRSDRAKILVGADGEAYEAVEIHRTTYDKSTGLSRMLHEKRVEIAPGKRLNFEPGGYHLMLIKPKRHLMEGNTVMLTLKFDDGLQANVEFSVRRDKFHL